ncbi:hypothetical protein AX777_06005 [Sphingobium yanoikuyae]|jgi:hypothetical protein|uniref:DUF2958 domain-containing protein n=1 Tax=Sphingobium yanoikuyae TaxID=13690 RepID=A0A177JQY2_SPHYA|nr:DUF2958 domain-containing protein [Sphingobium yanoikuyae]OAH42791.1 hypothetical protein AX777_06005 [Sphingobium yanoikuyae]
MEWTSLIRPQQLQQLIINHETQQPLKGTRREIDFQPVVALHIPDTYCLWLLSEVDNEGMAFGLCQIQVAEIGSVWLPEVADLDLNGVRVTEDETFRAQRTLSEYAALAKRNGGLLLL